MFDSRLYPLKFQPRLLEKIWGGRKIEQVLGKEIPAGKPIGESWELYDFPPGVIDDSDSWVSAQVINGPLAGQTLHELTALFGPRIHGDIALSGAAGQFPILIKFLDAREDLSLQVHPDAKYAATHPGAALKSEAWYIVQSDPGAAIYKGLSKGTSRSAFAAAIGNGTVMEHFVRVPARPGDCHYLPSGTVHALGAGLLVAEVQTPSDTTYRVFDYNRIEQSTGKPRALHVAQAMECIDFSGGELVNQPINRSANSRTSRTELVDCPFFQLSEDRVEAGQRRSLAESGAAVIICLEGEGNLLAANAAESTRMAKGQTILIPAELKKRELVAGAAGCAWLEVGLR